MPSIFPDPSPQGPDTAAAVDASVDRRVLTALRQIIRAVDLYSRRLVEQFRVTGPQLVCLNQLAEAEVLTVTELARRVQLSPSTVVRILDRLEARAFVTRTRSVSDRRVVAVAITPVGRQLSQVTPYAGQHPLRQALQTLDPADRARIADDLEHLVTAMDAPSVEAVEESLGLPPLVTGTTPNSTADH